MYRYSRDQRGFDPRDAAYGGQDYHRSGYVDRPPESSSYSRPSVDSSVPSSGENAFPLVAAAVQSQAPPATAATVPATTASVAPSTTVDASTSSVHYGDEYGQAKKMDSSAPQYSYSAPQSISQDSSYRDSFRGRDYPKYGDRKYESSSYDDRRDDRYGSGDYSRRATERSRYDSRYDDDRRRQSSGRDDYSRVDDRYGRSSDGYRRDSYSGYSRGHSRSRSRSRSPSRSHGRDHFHPYDRHH